MPKQPNNINIYYFLVTDYLSVMFQVLLHILTNPYHNPAGLVLLSLLYNQNTEMVNNLAKVTQLLEDHFWDLKPDRLVSECPHLVTLVLEEQGCVCPHGK